MATPRVDAEPAAGAMGRWRAARRWREIWRPAWTAPAALCAITALGLAIRAVNLNQGLFGDELSTAWIVHGRSLGRVISLVYSDDEITPPLSFVLAWISLKIGASWAWLRVPSLLAGTATIPIVYAIGVRTAGRRAGLIAGLITALSAVMIVYSDQARNYAELMAFVAASTLCALLALDTGRVRWWVAYGASSCLAMYSHYSAVFVLIAQALWLLWRHPRARRSVLLANVGAAIAYAPWIPGWIKDTHSVTVPILNAIVPFTPSYVFHSVAQWAVGYPYLAVQYAPGRVFALLFLVGVAVAVLGVVRMLAISRGPWSARLRGVLGERACLLALLAVTSVAGEFLYSVLGTHILDPGDLDPSLPALAVTVGVLVASAGPWLRTGSCALILSAYVAGAYDTLQARWQRPDYPAVARFIASQARRGDVVIDASNVPVVPLTGLDAYLPQDHLEFRLGLPEGPPPYTLSSKVPSASQLIAQASQEARGNRIFLVQGSYTSHAAPAALVQAAPGALATLKRLSPRYHVVESRRFPGIETLSVLMLARPG